MSVTFHTLLLKCIKLRALQTLSFKNMFLLNVIPKNESRQLYSTSVPYFNFEFCEAANPEWLSVLMGLLEFHYLLICAPAIYIRMKKKQLCFHA